MNDHNPRLISVATANPGTSYKQSEICDMLGYTDPRISKIFNNSHIESRNLCLPYVDGSVPEESALDLWEKNRRESIEIGKKSVQKALDLVNLVPTDIDYIACVTTTGFLCPGLSAHLIKEMKFRPDVHRIDIVGMGCNAGLNGMQPVVNYCRQNPNGYGLLVCIEICSAAYVKDSSVATAVVNSLFGDGSAAVIFSCNDDFTNNSGAKILDFRSHIVPDHINAMRFDYDGDKYSFRLEKDIPYVLGNNIEIPVNALLNKHGLKIRDIDHWVVHSGGQKVINSIKVNLDLSDHAVRHTEDVLAQYGNLSSGAFLFSYERLIKENVTEPGDRIFMITMGPGTTIECCLGQF
jgi:3,5-dihydroxyphenylacetyl-CoA synthase